MPWIEILDAPLPALDSSGPARFALESPRAEGRFEGTSIEIEGWLFGSSGPARLEIRREGEARQVLTPERHRSDVREKFPEAPLDCGFHGKLSFDDWEEARYEFRALIAGNDAVELGVLRARRIWREDAGGSCDPLVSVVIRAATDAAGVGEAIESVLAQTYPHLEIVLIAAPGAGNSEPFDVSHPAVRTISAEGTGEAAMNNLGVRRTVGDYLLFLDSRDRLTPNFLERGIQAFHDHPESAVVLGHRRALPTGANPSPEGLVCESEKGFGLYRRSLFDSVGVFDSGAREPSARMLRLIACKFPVHCHHEAVAYSIPKPILAPGLAATVRSALGRVRSGITRTRE
jgi:hypothetical protein